MKTKRFVSTLLALLLICSLPVSAFAERNIDAGDTRDEIEGDWDINNGTVGTNNGKVYENYGTVGTNNGKVYENNGTVDTNNGTVVENYGTVETNAITGKVTNNAKVGTNNGTVYDNYGTVDTNAITGTVTNVGGKVGTNYGTVIEVKGNDEAITTYGVQVVGENNNDPIRKDQGVDLDLAERFTKEGHVLTGYIQNYGMQNDKVTSLENPISVNGTVYTADCPNVLTLIWQAISSGSGEVAAAAAADNGAADFGPGIYISINGHQYMLVAVVEDVYCLASVESYEAEELADLPALLASLLTEEQLGYVTGEPELLDEELTAYFFAGRGSHIVFSCDKGLIFS